MIKLTNLADYSVVLMCHLAQKPSELHSAGDLAERSSIPVPTVSKILGSLSRADLLTSQRGLKGGFKLARPLSKITVAEIVEALDGPIALTTCVETWPGDCSMESFCCMKPHWQVINNTIRGALDSITLADIIMPVLPEAKVNIAAIGGSLAAQGQ